ncbi:MAG TPA: EAL domain-containing protein [Sulfuricurvum sp.]|nr:EAL domain-containing protein [Sulfuricurvum sp.]HQT36287.1 EAL domain-containing protein [Sulfuricurvum sp.]
MPRLLALAIAFIFIALIPSLYITEGYKDYLPLHMMLETIAIVIAMQVAGLGWSAFSYKIPGNIVFLASIFFGVAILDFSHLLSFNGMPDYVTPSGSDKGIYFWLVARLLLAIGLLIFAISTLRSLVSKTSQYLLLASLFILIGFMHWLILFHQELFPPMFIVEEGLTALKTNTEYVIIVLNVITAIMLWRRMYQPQTYDTVAMFAAVCVMAMSELFFTFYADVTDIYNISGHIYKAIAYLFIYRAIFVTTVQEPFEELNTIQKQLYDKNRLLDSIVNNIPHMIFLKYASDLRYALFNKAGEELTGLNEQTFLNHSDYEFYPKEQADFFIQKDRETLRNGIIVDIPNEPIDTPHGTRILHTKKIPIKDEYGQPQYLLGISEDITEWINTQDALRKSENFLKESQEIAALGSYTLDLRTEIWTSSKILDQLFGIDATYEHSLAGWKALIHPDEQIRMDHCIRNEVIENHKPFDQEYRIVRQDDQSVRWIHGLGKLEFDAQGLPVKMVGTIQDITSTKQLTSSLLKLSLAVEQSPNSIVITDLEGNIEYVNNMFTTVTGYSMDEALGKNPRILKSDITPQATYDDMWAHLTRGDIWHGELTNRRKDQSIYIEWATISPVKQADGKITNFVAIKEDITKRKNTEAHIQYLAHFDQLTGLANRVMLNDRVTYLLSMAQRTNEPLAVMFLDLDHFKNINDTLGHTIGDQVLIEMAKRIKETVRDEDTVARLGGDEFIMLFPNTDSSAAMHIATKLIAEISRISIIEHNELTITPSIGIAIYPNDGENFETLLKNADTAMYRVKSDSRNNFHFFTQEMQLNLARNLQLENALRHSLERNELEVYYQPQVAIEDGRIIGAEALLRWHHPELGMISPAEFIPIAESSGQIIAIGEWVLRTAIQQTKAWMDNGFNPMIIAINLSAIQFRQNNLLTLVTEILEQVQLPHEYLELELTEAVTMHDPESVIDVMNKFHEQGIRMSIDDFGTGYSSLSYLKQFKVYKLKIDQSFIRDISDDPDDRAIVSAIIDMAHNLGLQTIAEGVETAEQLAFLRLHGCNEVQGYYFSKPLPSVEFEQFLHTT